MQTNVHLPQLELTMENIRVATVRVGLGDWVTAGQSLIEIETEKAVVEVPSPRDGYVRRILVKASEQIGAKALLCILTENADEPLQDQAGGSAHEHAPLTPSLFPSVGEGVSARTGERVRRPGEDQLAPLSLVSAARSEVSEGPIKAAPAARKLAKDLRLDLATITGTGPDGRITVKDVQDAGDASASQAITTDWTPLPVSRLALIAQMQKSLAEIPQFHVARRFDVAPLLVKSEGITFTVRLVRAAAVALAQHPPLRTMIAGNNIRVAPVSVALAIETPRGLIAPALRGAGSLTLEQIAGVIKDFRERAQAGILRRHELIDAPFAISNLGMFGVDFFHAFVFHGQTAVLAVGRAVEGQSCFSLAADHRIVDGAEAARFLETLQEEILQA